MRIINGNSNRKIGWKMETAKIESEYKLEILRQRIIRSWSLQSSMIASSKCNSINRPQTNKIGFVQSYNAIIDSDAQFKFWSIHHWMSETLSIRLTQKNNSSKI